jgi:hypothetical protein
MHFRAYFLHFSALLKPGTIPIPKTRRTNINIVLWWVGVRVCVFYPCLTTLLSQLELQ